MTGITDCKSPLLLSLFCSTFSNTQLLQEAAVHIVALVCSEEDIRCCFCWGEPWEEVQCHTEQQHPAKLEFVNKRMN